MKKRHCMVVHAYYPLGETRVEREALALIQRGYEVDVLCLRDDGEKETETENGINIYRLPVKRHRGQGLVVQMLEYMAFFILVSVRLIGLQRRRGYGVVQVHNLPDFLVFAAIWPKLRGARIVLDLHDLMPDFYAARFERPMDSWPVRLVRWQERLSCRFADHVITVTDVWRESLIGRGIPSRKITVVMNVAHGQLFSRTAGVSNGSGDNGHFNVIYHGTLTHRYGVDLIVRAIDLVRKDIGDVRLTILGDGDGRDELIDLVDRLDLTEYVSFSQGFLPTVELPERIRDADAGVVPNRNDIFTDSLLPTKLLEYIALGVPVIAARTQGIGAYFSDSEIEFFGPGNVHELASCIRNLHDDSARRTELIENSTKFDEQYSWARVSEEYVALVDRLNGLPSRN